MESQQNMHFMVTRSEVRNYRKLRLILKLNRVWPPKIFSEVDVPLNKQTHQKMGGGEAGV